MIGNVLIKKIEFAPFFIKNKKERLETKISCLNNNNLSNYDFMSKK